MNAREMVEWLAHDVGVMTPDTPPTMRDAVCRALDLPEDEFEELVAAVIGSVLTVETDLLDQMMRAFVFGARLGRRAGDLAMLGERP